MSTRRKVGAQKTEEAKLIFMKGVAKDTCWMNDEARGKVLLLVEEIIYSHAVGVDLTTRPLDNGPVFSNTGNPLKISGPR